MLIDRVADVECFGRRGMQGESRGKWFGEKRGDSESLI